MTGQAAIPPAIVDMTAQLRSERCHSARFQPFCAWPSSRPAKCAQTHRVDYFRACRRLPFDWQVDGGPHLPQASLTAAGKRYRSLFCLCRHGIGVSDRHHVTNLRPSQTGASASLITPYLLGSRPWFPALILVRPLALPPARGRHNFQPKASCPSLSRRADIRLTVLAWPFFPLPPRPAPNWGRSKQS